MIVEINISYDEFLKFKSKAYSRKFIKNFTANLLKIDVSAIEDITFNYKRKYNAYLDGNLEDLQENFRQIDKGGKND